MLSMKNLRQTVGMVAFPHQIRKTIANIGLRRCSTAAINDELLLQKKLQQVYQRRNNTTVATVIGTTVSTGKNLRSSLSLSTPLFKHFFNNILSSSFLLPVIMGSTITATSLSTVLLRTITTSFPSVLWNENDGLYLISTMKRRKKMMNKHKLRKRRKKNRMKNKK